MVRPPTKIKVGPHSYETERLDFSLSNSVGACNNMRLKIATDKTLDVSMTREVILHELLHAIWYQTSLLVRFPDGDRDDPGEQIIEDLAPRILGLLRDNPRLVAFWTAKP